MSRLTGHFCPVALILLLGANLAIGHGDLELRIAQITRQISSTTNNPAPLYLQRAELEREHKNWKAAATDYDLAAKADPSLLDVEVCRAGMLVDSAQFEAALSHLNRLLDKQPNRGEAWILRGRAHGNLGKRQAAIADYQRGLQNLDHPPATAFVELARIQAADSQVEDALKSLETGLRRSGPNPALHAYALELQEQAGNKRGALQHLDALVDLSQRKEAWLVRRAKLLVDLGQIEEGRQSFEAALAQINKLPPRMQKSPTVEKLRAEIERGLAAAPSALSKK